MTRLRARSLVHAYGDSIRALDGVDLELEAGELVCLLGPNGSGKSTLLRVLAGTLAPESGAVELDGRPLERLSRRVRARSIASVPQSLRGLPEVAVEQFVLGGRYPYLGFWGRSTPADLAAVRRALDEADAADLAGRGLSELSGGQWQRVLVARALAQEADVLLFDEPTASLDPEHQVRVFGLIAGLTGAGRCALVATHELNLASRFADRVVLLDRGRIRGSGPPETMLRPDVLEPVYGRHLYYGRTTGPDSRPLVLPWPSPEGAGADGGRSGDSPR